MYRYFKDVFPASAIHVASLESIDSFDRPGLEGVACGESTLEAESKYWMTAVVTIRQLEFF
jgi:hypothetical protein